MGIIFNLYMKKFFSNRVVVYNIIKIFQWRKTFHMSGLIKEKRDVKNFTGIKIRAIANVEISQSDEESIIIEALPASINKIKT